jgi:hypothetical protein
MVVNRAGADILKMEELDRTKDRIKEPPHGEKTLEDWSQHRQSACTALTVTKRRGLTTDSIGCPALVRRGPSSLRSVEKEVSDARELWCEGEYVSGPFGGIVIVFLGGERLEEKRET